MLEPNNAYNNKLSFTYAVVATLLLWVLILGVFAFNISKTFSPVNVCVVGGFNFAYPIKLFIKASWTKAQLAIWFELVVYGYTNGTELFILTVK